MMRGFECAFNYGAVILIGFAPSCQLQATQRPANLARDTINLAGVWNFKPDPQNVGEREKWFEQTLPHKIVLPGSMAENGFGEQIRVDTKWTGHIVDRSWFTEDKFEEYRQPDHVKVPFWLTPVKHYVGPAWYQKEVIIPEKWAGKQIVLILERCHWQTQIWVDAKTVGKQNSLSTPHEYDLTAELTPGKHILTVCVDNSVKIPVGDNAHSISDHTQTNWNGITGDIKLQTHDSVWIRDLQVYPDVQTRTIKVRTTIGNCTPSSLKAMLVFDAATVHSERNYRVEPKQVSFTASVPQEIMEVQYPLGDAALLWDEFSPNLYRLTCTIKAGEYFDRRSVQFGVRQIATDGTQFTINGKKCFLRGTLECCIFPRTGYPPMDVEQWLRIIKIAKSHGLNHFRFHSWCPPEAAFQAANRLGFYFQVEGPFWTSVGDGGPIDEFIYAECDRILKEYGNHPSFCFLAYGNEPGGKNQKRFLGDLINHWKKQDARHLYTSASGWPIIPESDYHSSPAPRGHQWGAGLNSRMNARSPETITDYRDFVSQYKVPLVSHEIGQWCVYPNFEEIGKYTGVTRAYNFEIFRDSLKENYMLDQAHDFLTASGKLQTLCYKEEIESALRTPGFGGFQLLDLHDFAGQGTALVGVLDAFWDSKGYVTPHEYCRFACETVPLARMEKRIWTDAETFTAAIEISHFGTAPLEDVVPIWSVTDRKSITFASDALPRRTIPLGSGIELGKISLSLAASDRAQKLQLTVSIEGTDYSNWWDFWVYPSRIDLTIPGDILVTQNLDERAISALENGSKVLFLPPLAGVKGQIAMGFTPIFWNTAWTRKQAPHTLGILCSPEHPAFAEFPTDYHSNWQWWELVTRAQPMILTDFPRDFRPIIQVIDDWFTNRPLGLAFEAKVEKGKLLVCSIDLSNDLDQRLVARQLRYSLLKYISSPAFNPNHTLQIEDIKNLLQKPPALKSLGAKVIKVDSQADGYEGYQAIDGNADTIWHTPWGPAAPDYPHEVQIDLGKNIEIKGFKYLPRQDMSNGWLSKYQLYVSPDGQNWSIPAAAGTFVLDKREKTIQLEKPVRGRFVRLVAIEGIDNQPFASIAELDIVME
jgi:hypothetical protein